MAMPDPASFQRERACRFQQANALSAAWPSSPCRAMAETEERRKLKKTSFFAIINPTNDDLQKDGGGGWAWLTAKPRQRGQKKRESKWEAS